jgi:monoamine oxidase
MPSTDNWFIASGMGNFVAQFAAGLPIRYSTEVTNVDRSGSGVKVSTAAGTISAKAVIITASTAVLASGRPNFSPALPAEYTEAINNLPMGAVGKVGFQFDQDVFGGLTGTTSIVSIQPPAPDLLAAMFAKFFGSNECYIVLGGGAFREVEQAGEGAMTDLATQVVGGILGSDAVSHIVRTDTHSWLNDPWAMGAYSSAKIGHFSARKQLQEPIEGKVFFAGEAVALEAAGSMHGAWLTAEAAVGAYLHESVTR